VYNTIYDCERIAAADSWTIEFIWFKTNVVGTCWWLLQTYPKSRNSSVFSGVVSPFIEEENASIYTRGEEENEGKKMVYSHHIVA
jgi:hypothetical protein